MDSSRRLIIPGRIVVARENFSILNKRPFNFVISLSIATRFAEVSEEEVTIFVHEGVPQETKEATSYAVKVFEGKKKLLIGHICFKVTMHLTNQKTLTQKT